MGALVYEKEALKVPAHHKLVLVTGAPGVGKSSVTSYLEKHSPGVFRRVHYGDLISRVLGGVSEKSLRTDVSRFITREVLRSADSLLEEELQSSKSSGLITLVDSHAVSMCKHGFLMTPDGSSFFQKFRYSAIIMLYAHPRVVFSRSEPERSGRQYKSHRDVEMLDSLLKSVVVCYSSWCQCPALLIEAGGEVAGVAVNTQVAIEETLNG